MWHDRAEESKKKSEGGSRLSERIIKIIRSMYVDTRAKYKLGTLETEWVRNERGVRQGCILSPMLFSLYTEE